jgi:hypothetical protein
MPQPRRSTLRITFSVEGLLPEFFAAPAACAGAVVETRIDHLLSVYRTFERRHQIGNLRRAVPK